jgi:hypothetical protein
MKRIVILTTLFIAGFGCKKNSDDISGSNEINGKLYIENIYEGDQKSFVKSQQIFVSKDVAASSTSFLFSTVSDTNGYFSFKYLNDQPYAVHTEKMMSTNQNNNVLFSADTVLNSGQNIEFVLRPDIKKQNGLFITCVDTLIPAGRIPSAKIYIYTSRILAVADTAALVGAGMYLSFTAKLDGSAFKMNLPTDSLYVNTILTVGTLRLTSKLNVIKLDPTGVKTLVAKMKN